VRRAAKLAVSALAAAGLLTACGGSGHSNSGAASSTTTTGTAPIPVVQVNQATQFNPTEIYARDAPGVVTVISVFGGGSSASTASGGSAAQGSGFVISGSGELVTNAHVVTNGTGSSLQGAGAVYVKFPDGNEVPAKIVGADPNADVALLRIDPAGLSLRPLALGSSSQLTVGAPVVAMGTPFGEQGSLSVGVISATNRAIQSLNGSGTQGSFAILGAIQTDAAINHGNSGGPLVDARGAVIGINSQIAPDSTGGGSGVGFAVPVDAVKRSIAQLRAHGSVSYGYIGASSVPLFPQLAEHLGLKIKQGSLLEAVAPGGPGAKAGLQGGNRTITFDVQPYHVGGDVITKVNGRTLDQNYDLADAVTGLSPGHTITLEVWRSNTPRTVKLTLGTRPNSGSG
jgi:S1-C subfamily serine protease